MIWYAHPLRGQIKAALPLANRTNLHIKVSSPLRQTKLGVKWCCQNADVTRPLISRESKINQISDAITIVKNKNTNSKHFWELKCLLFVMTAVIEKINDQ